MDEKIKDINKEAYKQAEKELLEGKVEKVKGYILETLKKIDSKNKERQRIDEEVRILKLDLDDLRNGRFEKIEERIEKSAVARRVSVPNIEAFATSWVNDCLSTGMTLTSSTSSMPDFWNNQTAGTYNTGTRIIYF